MRHSEENFAINSCSGAASPGEQAAAYFGIGMNKLRELTEDENCKFVLYIGSKRLIKRQMFEKYLEQAYSL